MEWICVKDRLPYKEVDDYFRKYDNYPEFIVMIEGAEVPTVLEFDGDVFCDEEENCYPVTHWMPLPEPPKWEEDI